MASFGGFTVTGERHDSPRVAVYVARSPRAGDSAEYTIKLLRSGEGAAGPEELEAFVRAAELQREVAGAALHWVKVEAVGRVDEGAFAVYARPPRSLEAAIGRVAMPTRVVHHLLGGMLAGLAEWQERAQRGHGALEAANVLIEGEAGLATARVLLSEPAHAGGEVATAMVRDRRALGVILSRLVRNREPAGWPLEDSPEWRVLGPRHAAWREFCNHLLDPAARAEDSTPASLQERFARLPGAPVPTARKVLLGALAGIVLLGPPALLRFLPLETLPVSLQAWAERLGNEPSDEVTVPPEFGALCTAWYEWVGGLVADLEDPDRRARWTADLWLREQVVRTVDRAPELDPREITKDRRGFEALAARPPANAIRGTVVRSTRQAFRSVEAMRAALEAWPGRQDLVVAAEEFAARGWKGPAAEAARAAAPAASAADAVGQVDAALLVRPAVERARSLWQEFTALEAVWQATGDPVQARLLGLYERRLTEAESLADLGRTLETELADARRRASFAQDAWLRQHDRERYRQESELARHDGPLTEELLQAWDTAVADYRRIGEAEDPRQLVPWKELIQAAAETIAELRLEEEAALVPAERSDLARLDERLAREQAAVTAFLGRTIIAKDLIALATEIGAATARLQGLRGEARAVIDKIRPEPGAWLTETLAVTFPDWPALDAAWRERRDNALGGGTAASFAADAETYRRVRSRVGPLRTFFEGLNTADTLARLPPLAPGALRPETAAAVVAIDAGRRALLIQNLLSGAFGADGRPLRTVAEHWARAEAQAAVQSYVAAQAALAATAADFSRVTVLLEEGTAWDEGVEELVTRGRAGPWWDELGRQPGLGRIAAAAERLRLLAGEKDPSNLLQAAGEKTLAVALTAWRELGRRSDWPTAPEDVEAEARILPGLRELADVAPEPRRSRLLAEIESGTRSRYLAAWRRLGSPDQTVRLFDLQEAFGVDLVDLPEPVRYNGLLLRLKQTVGGTGRAEDIRRQRDRFVLEVRDLPQVSRREAVAKFSRDLETFSLAAAMSEETAPETIGPARRGWTPEFTRDRRRATFRLKGQSGPQQLAFLLIQPPGNRPPFYLGTEAISVGLLAELVRPGATGAPVIAALPSWVPEVAAGRRPDPRPGPLTWRPTGAGPSFRLVVPDRWVPGADRDDFAELRQASAGPNPRTPANYLPPRLALALARDVLGSRLLTTEEWSTLAEMYYSDPFPGMNEMNVRDATWLRQREHLAKRSAAGTSAVARPWPDSGIFVPRGAQPGRDAAAEATWPTMDDGALYFRNVDDAQDFGIRHLFGNVATFVMDDVGERFYVAGGSALSPREVDPRAFYPVEGSSEGFADVGLRLAFDAVPPAAVIARFSDLVKREPFLDARSP